MKAELLRILREAGDYVSGQRLCEQFGVSRTAVWKVMNQLKEEGYEIESVKNKGYRIREIPDVLTAQELKEQVGTALDQLEHFRSRECAGSVEEILRHELPEDMKERLLQIQEQLKLYEDDNAEELLRQLLAIF